jgi:hypothetical protein
LTATGSSTTSRQRRRSGRSTCCEGQKLLAPPKKPTQQEQQEAQDEQQGRDQQQQQQQQQTGEEPEWQPDFQESHLVCLGRNWSRGRSSVETVDAAMQLTDAWFTSNTLLVLLLPSPEPSAGGAAAASPARAGSKRRQPDPDMEDAALGQKYMLVMNSALHEGELKQLPVLLPLPDGPERHKAALKGLQVGCCCSCCGRARLKHTCSCCACCSCCLCYLTTDMAGSSSCVQQQTANCLVDMLLRLSRQQQQCVNCQGLLSLMMLDSPLHSCLFTSVQNSRTADGACSLVLVTCNACRRLCRAPRGWTAMRARA